MSTVDPNMTAYCQAEQELVQKVRRAVIEQCAGVLLGADEQPAGVLRRGATAAAGPAGAAARPPPAPDGGGPLYRRGQAPGAAAGKHLVPADAAGRHQGQLGPPAQQCLDVPADRAHRLRAAIDAERHVLAGRDLDERHVLRPAAPAVHHRAAGAAGAGEAAGAAGAGGTCCGYWPCWAGCCISGANCCMPCWAACCCPWRNWRIMKS